MSIEQIINSIQSHRKEEINRHTDRKSIGRSDAIVDDEANTYWLVVNNGGEIYDDGVTVSRDAPLGAVLIQNYEGTHKYFVRNKKYNEVYQHNIQIFNRASFNYDENLLATNIQIKIANDKKTYIYRNLSEVLENLSQIKKEYEKTQDEIKFYENEQMKIEEQYKSVQAREIEEKKKLETQLKEKKSVIIKLRKKSEEEEKNRQNYIAEAQNFIRQNAELRWQPILDSKQDYIKRIKIYDSGTLIINGGPGTGKTTSLIQRIKFLTSETIEEYISLTDKQKEIIFDKRKSWVFFSPNKLLALFLKNSMAQEGLSASDDTVRVWSKYKNDIIRLYGWLSDEKILFRPYRSRDDKNEKGILSNPNSVESLIKSFTEYYLKRQKESILKLYKNPNDESFKNFPSAFQYYLKMRLNDKSDSNQNIKDEDKNDQKAFNDSIKFFLDCIPKMYKEFRKECLKKEDNNWNLELLKEFISNDNQLLHSDEQALLIFIINTMCFEIYRNNHTFFQDIQNKYMNIYLNNCKPVIAIDEATDFNAIDLLAMQSLRHPDISSVTLSGDLMQRMTPFGINTWQNFSDQISLVEIENLTISYRQSPTLLSLAQSIYYYSTNTKAEYTSYMPSSIHEPKPLIKISTDFQDKIKWISKLIKEIDKNYRKSVGSLPSVAVFVLNEDDIENFVNELENVLDGSVPVTACKGGLVLGESSDVRVYAIDKIKGLEFEAAFFHDLDKLTGMEDNLMLKYLYVGLSRASFYIGVTMSNPFNNRLSFLKEFFNEKDTWDNSSL